MKEIEAFRAAISNRHFAAAEDILSAFYLTNIFPITRQKFWNILYVKLAILCAVFLFVINWAQNEVFSGYDFFLLFGAIFHFGGTENRYPKTL